MAAALAPGPSGSACRCRSARRWRRCCSRGGRWPTRSRRCSRGSRARGGSGGPLTRAAGEPPGGADPCLSSARTRWSAAGSSSRPSERAARPTSPAARRPRWPRPRPSVPVLPGARDPHARRDARGPRRRGRARTRRAGRVRVVPNKFPALRIEGELEPSGEGLYDRINGVGAHEVIIESPDHARCPGHAAGGADRRRALRLSRPDARPAAGPALRVRHGVQEPRRARAGASLEHPHSQLIATPIVPIMVEEELAGALRHFRIKKRCIWCDIVHQERRGGGRVIVDGGRIRRPRAVRAPLSVRDVDPARRRIARASRRPRAGTSPPSRRCSARCCGACASVLGDPPYNFMLHSAPFRGPGLDHFHWHLEIIPKLTRVAGFEWGTGFLHQPDPPGGRRALPSRGSAGGPKLTPSRALCYSARRSLVQWFAGIAQW